MAFQPIVMAFQSFQSHLRRIILSYVSSCLHHILTQCPACRSCPAAQEAYPHHEPASRLASRKPNLECVRDMTALEDRDSTSGTSKQQPTANAESGQKPLQPFRPRTKNYGRVKASVSKAAAAKTSPIVKGDPTGSQQSGQPPAGNQPPVLKPSQPAPAHGSKPTEARDQGSAQTNSNARQRKSAKPKPPQASGMPRPQDPGSTDSKGNAGMRGMLGADEPRDAPNSQEPDASTSQPSKATDLGNAELLANEPRDAPNSRETDASTSQPSQTTDLGNAELLANAGPRDTIAKSKPLGTAAQADGSTCPDVNLHEAPAALAAASEDAASAAAGSHAGKMRRKHVSVPGSQGTLAAASAGRAVADAAVQSPTNASASARAPEASADNVAGAVPPQGPVDGAAAAAAAAVDGSADDAGEPMQQDPPSNVASLADAAAGPGTCSSADPKQVQDARPGRRKSSMPVR